MKPLILLALLIFSPAWAGDLRGLADKCENAALCHVWFGKVMQPDNPQVSCCGEADAFEADSFRVDPERPGFTVVTITDERGIVPEGTEVYVPNSKITWKFGNPIGHGIIWINTEGHVYCWVPPGGV
jgi:hypothetical protein